jgi:hypothetical protein
LGFGVGEEAVVVVVVVEAAAEVVEVVVVAAAAAAVVAAAVVAASEEEVLEVTTTIEEDTKMVRSAKHLVPIPTASAAEVAEKVEYSPDVDERSIGDYVEEIVESGKAELETLALDVEQRLILAY